jgi:hypothetical protein
MPRCATPHVGHHISGDATVYYYERSFSFLHALMYEVPPAIRTLLCRLITSLPPEPSPWEGPNRPQDDFLGFEDFDDDELNLLATFLRSNPVSPEEALAANDDVNLFASLSSPDDEWDADDGGPYSIPKVTTYPLKAPVDPSILNMSPRCASIIYRTLQQGSLRRLVP